jgi:hypothetical protein
MWNDGGLSGVLKEPTKKSGTVHMTTDTQRLISLESERLHLKLLSLEGF